MSRHVIDTEPEPLRATLPPSGYIPLWRNAWTHRRRVGLIMLLLAVAFPPSFVLGRPAVVLSGIAGGMTGDGPFEDGAPRYQMVGIKNRMPYGVTITSIENSKIEFMSPPGFDVRVGTVRPGVRPEDLPAFKPFALRSHESVLIYLTATERCPEKVMADGDGFSATSLSSFRIHYRTFGIPMRVDLQPWSNSFGFREPTSKDCPSSSVR